MSKWMRAAAVLGIAAMCGCTRSSASRAYYTSNEWTFHRSKGAQLQSEHYNLYTTCRSKPFVGAIPAFMEACWKAYSELLPCESNPESKCDAYLFQTRGEWERFTEGFTPTRAAVYKRIRSGGYSEGGVTVSYYGSRRSTLSILAHEGLHQYLEVTRGRMIPAWINEGLACYFESFDLNGRGEPVFNPEKNTLRLPALRQAVASKSLIPLKDILATNAGIEVHKTGTRVGTYYSQEWSLVLFLLRPARDNPYHDGFQELLRELGTESMERKAGAMIAADMDGTMSQGEAIFRAYITDDLEAFQSAYERYLDKLLEMHT